MILIGAAIGYYSSPEKVKTVTKYKIKKVVEEKVRVETEIRELPSGEKITKIVYKNDRVEKSDLSRSETKEVTRKKLDWGVGVGPRYVSVDRRIIGTLSVGGYMTVNETYQPDNYGIYIRYSF